jgi:hypothetical protein
MTSIYSKRFLLGAGAGGSPSTYVVPALQVAVVHTISVATFTTATAVQVGVGSTWFYTEHFDFTAPKDRASGLWTGRVVLEAGETLELEASPGVTFAVSGYLLSAP